VSTKHPTSNQDEHQALSAPDRRAQGHVPGEVGVWVFIVGDMVVFAWFFIVYMHQRAQNVPAFDAAHKTLSLTFGGLNTLLLLSGSWFVVLALNCLRAGNQRTGKWLIGATLASGVGFVVNKALEWHEKIVTGHPTEQSDFFMYYFVLTGIHLLHLLIGLIVLTVMWRVARKEALGPKNFRTLEAGACYWHLVDLLWLVLFALFYLVAN
jgi:nitric oxide reductase NorE protein